MANWLERFGSAAWRRIVRLRTWCRVGNLGKLWKGTWHCPPFRGLRVLPSKNLSPCDFPQLSRQRAKAGGGCENEQAAVKPYRLREPIHQLLTTPGAGRF